MAGAICQNRTLALESHEEFGSINLHVANIERELQGTKEYLLLPRTGLAAKMETMEKRKNENIASF
jgi:hypothetical protein